MGVDEPSSTSKPIDGTLRGLLYRQVYVDEVYVVSGRRQVVAQRPHVFDRAPENWMNEIEAIGDRATQNVSGDNGRFFMYRLRADAVAVLGQFLLGVIRVHQEPRAASIVSIHAARAGGDGPIWMAILTSAVSIHAARAGGDAGDGEPLAARARVSIHAARAGGDQHDDAPHVRRRDVSIHAARAGGDGLAIRNVPVMSSYFVQHILCLSYYSAEFVQDLTDKLYGAARFSGISAPRGYPLVGQASTGEYFFSGLETTDLERLSVGLGYQFAPPLVVKVEYSAESGHTVTGESHGHRENLFSSEVGLKF